MVFCGTDIPLPLTDFGSLGHPAFRNRSLLQNPTLKPILDALARFRATNCDFYRTRLSFLQRKSEQERADRAQGAAPRFE
jgi:hypothetical protein